MENIEVTLFSSPPDQFPNLPQSLPNFEINTYFTSNSYIELFAYSSLSYPEEPYTFAKVYDYRDYTVLNDNQSALTNEISTIVLNPTQSSTVSQILKNTTDQDIIITYNFYDKKIGSFNQRLYISEISSDRTELRLDSIILSTADILNQTQNFIFEREGANYFIEFYLNFGDNKKVLGINLSLDKDDISNPNILVKLSEPLPLEFDLNSNLWIVTLIEDPISYRLTIPSKPIVISDTQPISGPNFNLDLKDQVNNSTNELSYIDLITSPLTSSINQLNSILEETQLDINIDYSDFSNFIHFSSAQTRIENFYYKVTLLEQYSSSISILNSSPSSPNISSSIAVYENKMGNIITNFDSYEYYLYYESGSWAWPKTNTEPPYQLAQTNTPQVINWLGNGNEDSPLFSGILASASLYDRNNRDNLKRSIPEYLRDDSENEPYELFIDMVAQHYDSVWVYIKDVINKYDSDNRLNFGISRDLVADAIRDFGVKLYQNNFSNEDLYTAFLGLTPEGGLFPFPNITNSLPTPSGFEYVNTLISASNDYMPLDDVNKSLYKRIYHNLPYLLKSKGTLPGLRALITSYGIPDTILRINEYGGKDKVDSNDWDYWQDEFNYAFYVTASTYMVTEWELNHDWNSPDNVPATLAFRFKTDGLPFVTSSFSQSLWYTGADSNLILQYTGSGYNSGSYSGSIIDPYYQYANLIFYPDIINYPNSSASIYLPFFDGGWWSVMVTREGDNFNLYAGNKIYEGGDNGTLLGFYTSSSITEDSLDWVGGSVSIFGKASPSFSAFAGSLQEVRYYTTVLSESVFKDYIMNPYSTEGNSLNSGPNELAFRAPLGGELYFSDNQFQYSIHPKVTGSWIPTSSFENNSSNEYNFSNTPTFVPNTEYFFYDQPIAGIKNTISDKIRIENNVIPEGDTLSPFMSLSQMSNVSQSYTQNINYLEVAFSPQNEINEDIMDQIGSFNIGEFIGDPRLRSSSAVTYPDLDQLRNEYFTKYIKNYNLTDFIRLIKFFDNSLFKMIRDFVPARTSLASGVVIKQHLLERNKYPQPQVNTNSTIAYYGSGSQNNLPHTFQNILVSGTLKPTWNGYEEGTVENFKGGTGGTFEQFNSPLNISQSWIENISTLSGSVLILHNSQDEFYDGEFSGSNILVSNGIVNEAYPTSLAFNPYKTIFYYASQSLSDPPPPENTLWENGFLNPNLTIPNNGEILIYVENNSQGFPYYVAGQPKYLKISRKNCDGQDLSIPIKQLNKISIQTSFVGSSSGLIEFIPYEIELFNEYPDFFVFKINNLIYPPSILPVFIDVIFPNEILDYRISASYSTSPIILNGNSLKLEFDNVIYNPNNFYNSLTGLYSLLNTPNTELTFTLSGTASALVDTVELQLFAIITGSNVGFTGQTIDSTSFTASLGSPEAFSWNGTFPTINPYYDFTFNPVSFLSPGKDLFFQILNNNDFYTGNVQFSDLKLTIHQLRSVDSSSVCSPVIFEPYITVPNFYNSDENALLNNAFDLRNSSYYLDVDYTRGITTPVNFDQLIDGSATKAKVVDSNYTTKRHVIPRYEGSKSTSQLLNIWSLGDTGTYGKIPTVENLQSYVAYGYFNGSWAPERMNTSTFLIKYLIDKNGEIFSPNASLDTFYLIQQNFLSGNRFRYSSITSEAGSGGVESQYRTIIRGGTRIEPILYTQSGSAPNAQWNTTMSFEDIIPSDQGAIQNYTALFKKTTTDTVTSPNTNLLVTFNSALYGNTYLSSDGYEIPLEAIQDGVNLTFNIQLNTTPEVNILGTYYPVYGSDIEVLLYNTVTNTVVNQQISQVPSTYLVNYSFTLNSSQLQANDIYKVYIKYYNTSQGNTYQFNLFGSFTINQISRLRVLPSITSLKVTQYPLYTQPVTSSISGNSIWGYVDTANYPYVITSSNQTLVELYDAGVKQSDISGSGFNPIILPWSIKYGDEFRFEGREDYTFTVGKIFPPQYSGSNRISETGSIEVHFDKNLPISASLSAFNLDHFLIRRYVGDSQIMFEGFRPQGSSYPNSFIVIPEYVIPELDKNIDEYIKILTEKGLIG